MKNWYQSKTIWFAILTGAVGIVTSFSTQYPDVGWLVTIGSVINVILRLVTSEPIQ